MEYKYCPNCKSNLTDKEGFYECFSCGMKIFKNSAPTASVLIVRDEKILLAVRSIEPKKGMLDIIGGFLGNGEDPKSGAMREVKEESGLEIELIDLLGVYMDKYKYQERIVDTLNFVYVGKIIKGTMRANDDVAKLLWFKIGNTPNMAFNHQSKTLKDLEKWYKEKKL